MSGNGKIPSDVYENDRHNTICKDCEIIVPIKTSDIQAGIVVYCPKCKNPMELVND